jgi:hypothetical protein
MLEKKRKNQTSKKAKIIVIKRQINFSVTNFIADV